MTSTMKVDSDVKEVLEAYSDCNVVAGDVDRDLDFHGQTMPVARAIETMYAAIPFGYNHFRPHRVATFLHDLEDALDTDLDVVIAREGSVCLYIQGSTWFAEEIADAGIQVDTSVYPDEYDVSRFRQDEWLRIWWD